MPDAAPVQIVMGSQSDANPIRDSKMTSILDEMGIGYELSVCSAHRNPKELHDFAESICQDGVVLFIGVAGMAAALPGALAGATSMAKPVLAVPLDEHGIDSCLYMPPGVPVSLTGVGKSGLRNAAITAAQIMGVRSNFDVQTLVGYVTKNNKPAKFNVKLEELTS